MAPKDSQIGSYQTMKNGNLVITLLFTRYQEVQVWNMAENKLVWTQRIDPEAPVAISHKFDDALIFGYDKTLIAFDIINDGPFLWKHVSERFTGQIKYTVKSKDTVVIIDSNGGLEFVSVKSGKQIKFEHLNLSLDKDSLVNHADDADALAIVSNGKLHVVSYHIDSATKPSIDTVSIGGLNKVIAVDCCGGVMLVKSETTVVVVKLTDGKWSVAETISDLIPVETKCFYAPKAEGKIIKSDGVVADVLSGKSGVSALNVVDGRVISRTADLKISAHKQSELLWSREESLSDISSSLFIELPIQFLLEKHYVPAKSSSLFSSLLQRWKIHIRQFSDFITNNSVQKSSNTSENNLVGDKFGFRQLVLVSTAIGKLIAFDSTDGRTVWSRHLPDFKETNLKLFAIQSAHSAHDPLVAVVAQSAHKTNVKIINALTGEIVESGAVDGVVTKVVRVPYSNTHAAAALVSSNSKINVFPKESIEQLKNTEFRSVIVGTDKIVGTYAKSFEATVKNIWEYKLAKGESIVALSEKPQHNVAALQGRILGDRSVMYKYLNPNTLVFATLLPTADRQNLVLNVLDTVTGRLVHQSVFDDLNAENWNQVLIAETENIIAMYYWADYYITELERNPVPRLVVTELFQTSANTTSNHWSSYSQSDTFHVSQSFQLKQPLTAMAYTTTDKGITAKDLVVATAHNQIASIPRQILDARRKPATEMTADEKAEALLPYMPIIDIPQANFMSYYLDLYGIKSIKSTPTLLESSTLVLAHGFDLFMTRQSPSKSFDRLGESFAKHMPVYAIVFLLVATLTAWQVSKQKTLQQQWK